MKTIKRKYHYFYKITNNLNGHYYYGIHSTDDLNDGYMGSGTRLKYAYKKYGIENFTKEFLKFFENREDCAAYEAEVVNEILIRDTNCYNVSCGGESWNTIGTVSVIDIYGNGQRILVDDPRLSTGEFLFPTSGKGIYKDKDGNIQCVDCNDPRVLSGELIGCTAGKVAVMDKNGNKFSVSADDPRYLSGELVGCTKGKITVKDKAGNYFSVSIDDPRYLSGELKPIWFGKKHKQETKEKWKTTYKRIKHQQGEKNSQYGTCWITKEGKNKKIKKEELEIFEQQGWKKGRVMK